MDIEPNEATKDISNKNISNIASLVNLIGIYLISLLLFLLLSFIGVGPAFSEILFHLLMGGLIFSLFRANKISLKPVIGLEKIGFIDFLLLVAVTIAYLFIISLNSDWRQLLIFVKNIQVLENHKFGILWFLLIFNSIIAVSEELFSTYLCFSYLRKKLPLIVSIVINSIVFWLLHLDFFSSFYLANLLNRVVFSLISTTLYVKYKKLLPSMIFHFLADSIILLMRFVLVSLK